jgi:hypothetical protein
MRRRALLAALVAIVGASMLLPALVRAASPVTVTVTVPSALTTPATATTPTASTLPSATTTATDPAVSELQTEVDHLNRSYDRVLWPVAVLLAIPILQRFQP